MGIFTDDDGTVTVEVETSGFYRAQARIKELQAAVGIAAYEATADATDYAADIIRAGTPRGYGAGRGGVRSHAGSPHLASQWVTRIGGPGPEYAGEIINRADYAAAVEEGAAARFISVKRKKFLWWPGIRNARMKVVDWPGFGGRHMGSRGLNAATAGVFKRYNDAVERAVRRIFG